MVGEANAARQQVSWSDDALALDIRVDDDGVARMSYLVPGPGAPWSGAAPLGLPLLDVVVAGSGCNFSGRRYSESAVGARMRYAGCSQTDDGPWHELTVSLEDPVSGLAAAVTYRVLTGNGVVRCRAKLRNAGSSPIVIESVTSFLGGGVAGPNGSLDDVAVLWAENAWLAESRWQARQFREALPDLGRDLHELRSRDRFGFTSTGTWSSGTYLPLGALVNHRTGYTLVWQIEHNGGWHWQVGEQTGEGPGGSYLALLGPTDVEHHWRVALQPGEELETVPVAVATSGQGFDDAVARLTRYRRALRRPHDDHSRLPVIFNDYMNTLMGDPTTDRLLPLIAAAARAGAEYFCIDAGWYAELGEDWWDTVGQWEPSKTRFPNGIGEVLDRIREEGMVPGLWLEPEVVGVNSPMADTLPLGAFFRRGGTKVVENGRYQLDFSHREARAHLDRVIDYLVGGLGVGYLKMDYNINIAPGTEPDGACPGTGMLQHNRAFLSWLDGVLDRYPHLTIENCSSGGMRTDYAMLSRMQLQSTSDQQDALRYAPIAAAAPAAMAPEQAAVWAYPQPEWDDDNIAFTLCNAMLGRVHLSGHLDRMTIAQQRLVAEGMSVYKQVRLHLAEGVPFWPLGLPGWASPWVALGMRSSTATHLVVWRRNTVQGNAAAKTGPAEVLLPLAPPGTDAHPRLLFPLAGAQLYWDSRTGQLGVSLPRTPSACLIGFPSMLPGPVVNPGHLM